MIFQHLYSCPSKTYNFFSLHVRLYNLFLIQLPFISYNFFHHMYTSISHYLHNCLSTFTIFSFFISFIWFLSITLNFNSYVYLISCEFPRMAPINSLNIILMISMCGVVGHPLPREPKSRIQALRWRWPVFAGTQAEPGW